jgi:glutamate synthase (ferredoxin)
MEINLLLWIWLSNVLTGRSLPEVMMMVVPEAWEKHQTMSDDKKAFYEYNACIMDLGWPASIPFTDGNVIGALLDRNGLRPSLYPYQRWVCNYGF